MDGLEGVIAAHSPANLDQSSFEQSCVGFDLSEAGSSQHKTASTRPSRASTRPPSPLTISDDQGLLNGQRIRRRIFTKAALRQRKLRATACRDKAFLSCFPRLRDVQVLQRASRNSF